MQNVIYVRLLGEGTEAFRPVLAKEIGNCVYEIDVLNPYDPEDEVWEFRPGTRVKVKPQYLSGGLELVAVAKWQNIE